MSAESWGRRMDGSDRQCYLSPIKPDLLPKPETQILDLINIKENGRNMPLIVLIWQTLTEPRPFAWGYMLDTRNTTGDVNTSVLVFGGGTKKIQETSPDVTPVSLAT